MYEIYFLFFCRLCWNVLEFLHTCLIFDLITGEAVQTKRDLYFIDPFAPEIDEVSIVLGNLCVRRGRCGYTTEHTVTSTPSPEPEAEKLPEVDQIPFLPSPLLRPSVHVIHDDSRTPSPAAAPKRKGRKGKKIFKH
jgi:hypothetical protein